LAIGKGGNPVIPFDFDYYRPDTINEATRLFAHLDDCRKDPLYFGGGTEIITFARTQDIYTKAIIDLKAIPECNVMDFSGDGLIIGACVSLTRIADSGFFPLLGKVCTGIADHTVQGKITIGGNICGRIIYHEAILPLFLTDCTVIVVGKCGWRQLLVWEVFDKKLHLNEGEFIVQFVIDRSDLRLPYFHIKRTRSAKGGYPLISMAAIKVGGRIRVAFSGLCSFPFRSLEMEEYLNEENLSYTDRVRNAIASIPAPLLDDQAGTSEYRRFVLYGILMKILKTQNEVGDV
jgi:CO/xanthine dehydrogenase FAD-binding subunit